MQYKVSWTDIITADSHIEAAYLALINLSLEMIQNRIQVDVSATGDNPVVVSAEVPRIIIHAPELYKRLKEIKEEFFDSGLVNLPEFNSETRELLNKAGTALNKINSTIEPF